MTADHRPLIEAPLQFRMKSGGTTGRASAMITCPKCDAPAFIRRSQRVSALVKHIDAHCTNTGCGHTFMLELVFIHSYNPGLIDRPDLHLTLCPREKVPHVLPPAPGGGDEDPDQMTMFASG
jgi:hypothetical protein